MENEKTQVHSAAGAAGDVGAAGELGTNGAGAERPATPAATSPAPAAAPLTLVPAQVITTEEKLAAVLVEAGYPAADAKEMAASAIAEGAALKGK
jgi:hypothetical protein